MASVRFDCKKQKGVRMEDGTAITSFVMRETTGKDEEGAAVIAKERGGAMGHLQELMRLAFVEVNGEPVNVNGLPYLAFDKWNSKARSLALTAYRSINMTSDEEDRDFLDAAVVCDIATPAAK